MLNEDIYYCIASKITDPVDYINTVKAFNIKYSIKNNIDWDIKHDCLLFGSRKNCGGCTIYSKFTEDFCEFFENKIQWIYIALNNNFSTLFKNKHYSKIDWEKYSEREHDIYEYELLEFCDFIHWDKVVCELSDDTIRKFAHKINFNKYLFYRIHVPIDILEKYYKNIFWEYLDINNKLSENVKEFFLSKFNK